MSRIEKFGQARLFVKDNLAEEFSPFHKSIASKSGKTRIKLIAVSQR